MLCCSMLIVIAASQLKKQGVVCMKRSFRMKTGLLLLSNEYCMLKCKGVTAVRRE